MGSLGVYKWGDCGGCVEMGRLGRVCRHWEIGEGV